MLKKQIVDILKLEVNRIHRVVPFDGMYDETAEKIMELFNKDGRGKLQTKEV